ncbi:uncharacterized protein LOC123874732 [Maniola jurtina]|uniref:uncharacterized protein LOC123874732 n=1 Tax=Maniola jurtina TaxID=191418 RepID=UPI001E68B38E|nr:uncharacterized protein LOC123874732 [Maniola jurtina]
MFYRLSEDNTNPSIDRITLYEKYKLVERTEPEVNGVWKGAHLLLFFLAFVFGSFCTFCFHMLMYLFDEKCVLFPKLMSLTSLHQNMIYEFIPDDKDATDMLPVDFLSTQWVEKSACLLPTYVPLVSGIFGLVWTTMFLMCSIGSRILTGLQRPWRVLPPVFVFSVVMGSVCIYTSAVTHHGLEELCFKLNEITGSSSCSYTINVATLAYQRRIRGVYQATRLTIASAWLHTACWVLSALLALARVLLAVDFKLVRVSVQLQGNIDRMLERHEKQIRTVSPAWTERTSITQHSRSSIRTHFIKKLLKPKLIDENKDGDLLYYTHLPREMSESALVTAERLKLDKLAAISAAPEEHRFIVKILYDLLDTADDTRYLDFRSGTSFSGSISGTQTPPLTRHYGQLKITSTLSSRHSELNEITSADIQQAEEMVQEINRQLHARLNEELNESNEIIDYSPKKIAFKSSLMIASEDQLALDKNITTDMEQEQDSTNFSEPSTSKGKEKTLKPSLKQVGVQTDEKVKDKSHKVQIDSRDVSESKTSQDKETQTKKEKEKQD